MHISLDAALQRQPLLSTVGDKLLPAFPGAAAAYSLRALNGNGQNVVRVRRSSDNAERDFTAEGVSFELEDWVGAGNDGFVETWYDQSGNGNHAVQLTTDEQPKIVSAGSLLDELSFDGVDDYMDITSLTTLSNPFTMFQVVDLDNVNITPSAFRPTIDGITTPVHRIITGNAEGSSEDGFFAGTATLSASSIVTDIALRTYFFRGDSTSEYFRNGTSVASGNVGSQTPSSGIRIAADHDLSGSNSQIRFKEFIIYNTDQTANRTGIESNIADEYGITLP